MGLLFIRRLFSFCAAEDVLDFFRDSFIKWTDANTVLHELRHRKIISDGDLTKITGNPDAKQQNEILHRCLTRSCDEEALMEVCDMMIAVDGNRRMNALGQKMKFKLKGKKIVERAHVVCVCVSMKMECIILYVLMVHHIYMYSVSVSMYKCDTVLVCMCSLVGVTGV